MKKILVISLLLLLSLLLVSQAAATEPDVVIVTYEMVSIENGIPWFEGRNTFNTFSRMDKIEDESGLVDLTETLEGEVIIHPNGKITWKGYGTFEGTVNGSAGTFYTRSVGQNMVGVPPELIHGQNTIIGGTGDFENLHGTMVFSGTIFEGSGTAQFHIDP